MSKKSKKNVVETPETAVVATEPPAVAMVATTTEQSAVAPETTEKRKGRPKGIVAKQANINQDLQEETPRGGGGRQEGPVKTRIRELLAKIAAENKGTWYRVFTFPSKQQASVMRADLKDQYPTLEMRASVFEPNESALYARSLNSVPNS